VVLGAIRRLLTEGEDPLMNLCLYNHVSLIRLPDTGYNSAFNMRQAVTSIAVLLFWAQTILKGCLIKANGATT